MSQQAPASRRKSKSFSLNPSGSTDPLEKYLGLTVKTGHPSPTAQIDLEIMQFMSGANKSGSLFQMVKMSS
jgi:hypothetical protein